MWSMHELLSPQANNFQKQEEPNFEQVAIRGSENPELAVLKQKCLRKEDLSYQEIEKF